MDSLLEMVASDLDDPRLQGLGMFISLKGASDAGQAHGQIHDELFGQLHGELFARFNADELTCYAGQRPAVTYLGDHFAAYQKPVIELYLMTDGLDRRFWYLTGREPDLKWEQFTAELLSFVDAFNAGPVASINSLPMPVPHTRPVGVTAHGNRKDLIEEFSTWSPSAELPASVVDLLEIKLSEASRDVVGYSLHTPHYLAEAEYPAVAIAALEYVGAALNLALPTENLREAGRLIEGQLAEQISGSSEVMQMVAGFEKRFDAHAEKNSTRSLLLDKDLEMPDAEQIGSRVEEFLATISDLSLWLDDDEDDEDPQDPDEPSGDPQP